MESAVDMFYALKADEYWSRLTAKQQDNGSWLASNEKIQPLNISNVREIFHLRVKKGMFFNHFWSRLIQLLNFLNCV